MKQLFFACGLAASVLGHSAPLWSNGPYITKPGAGFNGADASEWTVFNTPSGPIASNIGVNHGFFRVIEDFEISGNQPWKLQEFASFAFRSTTNTTFPPVSTFASVHVAIFTSDPVTGSPTPIWGDFVTNRYSGSGWTGAYRVSPSDLTNRTRGIMEVRADLASAPILNPGKYWIEYGLQSTSTSSPVFAVGVSPVGSGNAFQRDIRAGVTYPWAPVETAFELRGTVVPDPASFLVLAGGLGVFLAQRRRRR